MKTTLRPSGSWIQTELNSALNIMKTSLTNHSQSVIYSHSLSSTSYWQCHLHTILSFAHNTFCILISYHILYLFFLWLLLMSPCSTCLHIPPPPPSVMLILIFNSTAYCHAHSLILYILYSVLLYLIFYSFYFMHTSLVLYSTIFALSMERTWFTFHCWLYNLCIVVYVTNKTWNLIFYSVASQVASCYLSNFIKKKVLINCDLIYCYTHVNGQ